MAVGLRIKRSALLVVFAIDGDAVQGERNGVSTSVGLAAVDYLVAEIPDKDLKRIASTERDTFTVEAHMGLGMWIRNNLDLWAGGALTKDLRENHDCFMADDMSDVILEALWERLQES